MNQQPHKKVSRPPVVVILGHIDHGKSTLLDSIRKSNTTAKEAGGITQHLGAYEAHISSKDKNFTLTFLDTPGHAAFQTIRSRGVSVADIGVLIVSAEDGVKEQTIEAINIIRESNLPFVVAVNKIDSPKADIEKTLASLAEQQVFVEGRGGDIPYARVSAKTGEGVDTLLELILLVSELEEFTADPNISAEGFVIEAGIDPKKGTFGTLLILNGSLKSGMHVAAGKALAPVRILEDASGKLIKEATFSAPVRIYGFSSVPFVGSPFKTYASKKSAEKAALEHTADETDTTQVKAGDDVAVIPVVIKADAVGSIDAIKHELSKHSTEFASIRIIKSDVGAIGESDVQAAGGNAKTLIAGFNVAVKGSATQLSERDNIAIGTFTTIYDLSEWLAEEVKKRIPKRTVRIEHGKAKILKAFSRTKEKQVLGGRVLEGVISVGDRVQILRRGESIDEGRVSELQRMKDKAESVQTDEEFGIKVEARMEIVRGDELVAFAEQEA